MKSNEKRKIESVSEVTSADPAAKKHQPSLPEAEKMEEGVQEEATPAVVEV